MSRLIDACSLPVYSGWVKQGKYETYINYVPVSAINSAPTIERPIAKWVLETHDDGYGEFQIYACSNCGKWTARRTFFCADCGAKMEGVEDENDCTFVCDERNKDDDLRKS